MAQPKRDLFNIETEMSEKTRTRRTTDASESYTAADIEVLEGLEPVRRHPGMYIGGTDEKALHHLFAEVLDNSMDEAVAGHASWIEVRLTADGYLSVVDNGRGIPVDPHPKFKNRKSALEVIMTTLHSGGKFDAKNYSTSGGLHGVGISVVNALSEACEVEVARGQQLYRHGVQPRPRAGQARKPRLDHEPARHQRPLQAGRADLRQGRRLQARPSDENGAIEGLPVRRRRDPLVLCARTDQGRDAGGGRVPLPRRPQRISSRAYQHQFHGDLLNLHRQGEAGRRPRHGGVGGRLDHQRGRVSSSYCNTIPTPEGGTHENGLRQALYKGLRAYGDLVGNKKAGQITSDDVMGTAASMLSVFIRGAAFQGQTKDKLATQEATKIVETTVRDAFDHWLADSPQQATKLLEWTVEQAEERLKRRREKEVGRQSATRKLRLPGKLSDCSIQQAAGTEIFIVEGNSAGGSAKSARNRETQAILPLRGKILNVANASLRQAVAEPAARRPDPGARRRHGLEIPRR